MNVLEAIQRSAEYLGKKGVESPRLNAELLLSHVLGVARMKLYLDFERILQPAEADRLREMVVRRGKREPLQQITGTVSFCGLDLRVTSDVLAPRPETELLAELGWKALQKAVEAGSANPQALDFGTGSGCLAIALAVKTPKAMVTAIDISPAALAVARENAAKHQVSDRIKFLQSDGFLAISYDLRFELIVANPPYIPSGEIPALQPEVRDFEPAIALDGGPDGLSFYRRLATEARDRVQPGGAVLMEFGDGQASAIEEIFRCQNWVVELPTHDYTGRPRILVARSSLQSQQQ